MSDPVTSPDTPEMSPLPSDVWQHPENGQRWYQEGLCVTCGDEKEQAKPYHCDACYTRIFPAIFDYDDD